MKTDLIQSAFPAVETEYLRDRVRNRVHTSLRRKQLFKRTLWGSLTTASVVSGFIVVPVARGTAFMAHISGALEDVKAFQSVSYNVLPDGTQVKKAEVFYDDGKWRFEEPGSLLIHNGGENFVFDDWMKAYIREPKPNGPMVQNGKGLGLEYLLKAGTGTFVLESDDLIELKGVQTRRVEVRNGSRPEWMRIDADPSSGLPSRIDTFSMRGTSKELNSTILFDYTKPEAKNFLMPYDDRKGRPVMNLPYYGGEVMSLADRTPSWYPKVQLETQPFNLATSETNPILFPGITQPKLAPISRPVPVLTRQDWEDKRAERLASRLIAKKTVGKTPIAIRDIAYEGDGTVWVAYETSRKTRGFAGYGLSVESKTPYCHALEIGAFSVPHSDRRIDVQCFVPLDPVTTSSFTLTAGAGADGALLRSLPLPGRNRWAVEHRAVSIGSFDGKRFYSPTPGYLHFDWGRDYDLQVNKAKCVAEYWDFQGDVKRSLVAHQKLLNLMREYARQGHGPWDEASEEAIIRKLEGRH